METNNLLGVDLGEPTPRTPEILNSLIAMTNPMDNVVYTKKNEIYSNGNCTTLDLDTNCISNDSCSSTGSIVTPTRPQSVQYTCSQLIKAGLKLSIQSKRKLSTSEDSNSNFMNLDSFKSEKTCKSEFTSEDEYEFSKKHCELTPEDEERRQRRRERNKIAATKCRLKKREKTMNLVNESETLEIQNVELKNQISDLENELKRLSNMLNSHRPSCIKVNNKYFNNFSKLTPNNLNRV